MLKESWAKRLQESSQSSDPASIETSPYVWLGALFPDTYLPQPSHDLYQVSATRGKDTQLDIERIKSGLASYHIEYWDWLWAIKDSGVGPDGNSCYAAIWPRGWAKCLAADTEILYADGTRKPIREVAVGDRILGVDEPSGQVIPTTVRQTWHSGEKPVIRVRTRSGHRVTLTKEHRVWTYDGWRESGYLRLGDRIASPRHTSIEATDVTHKTAEVKLLAYMLAEGSTTSGNASFTNADAVIVEDFIRCAEELGFTVKQAERYAYDLLAKHIGKRSPARTWLTSQGLTGKLSKDKRVPSWVFRIPDDQKWAFLAAFIDTDGWVAHNGKAGITLASEGMIEDIRYLFTSLGVVTTVRSKPNDKSGAWQLTIDQESLLCCSASLPVLLKKERLLAIAAGRYSLLDTYPKESLRALPFGLNRRMRVQGVRIGTPYAVTRSKARAVLTLEGYEPVQWLEEAQVYWDEVVELSEVGEAETYDLEVDREVHSLISNGLVSHNSTNVEIGVVALAAHSKRRYGWYISGKQTQADDHLSTVSSRFTSTQVHKYYPQLAAARVEYVGERSRQLGWRRRRIWTQDGFVIDALGLDSAARGAKLGDQRPDFMIFDDIDEELDSEETIERKIAGLTRRVIPAASTSCIFLVAQNRVHPNGIVSRLTDGRATYLGARTVSGPHVAIEGLVYTGTSTQAIITAGRPTWEHMGLEVCQKIIQDAGIASFLAECQNQITYFGEPRFDRGALDIMAESVRPPLSKGLPEWALDPYTSIWQLPIPGVPYAAYFDGAEGVGSDYCVTVIGRADTRQMVAMIRDNKREQSHHARVAAGLIREYNNAFVGWERSHEADFASVLMAEGITRVYEHSEEQTLAQRINGTKPTTRKGYPARQTERRKLVARVANYIVNQEGVIFSEVLLSELRAFIKTERQPDGEAGPGAHDDAAFGFGGFLIMCDAPGARSRRQEGDNEPVRYKVGW